MLDTLKVARDSIPNPQPDVSVLQQQLAAVQQAEAAQREAFERQRQIAAAMAIEREQPKEPPQLSEKDLEWLGARPNVQADPTFSQSVAALAHVYKYGSDDFYRALDLRYPVSNFRRVEPKYEDSPASSGTVLETPPEERPQRRIVTSGPVSRSGGASGGYVPSANSVKLTAAEAEVARSAGWTVARVR
jgi:hypothetical protein